MATKVKKVSKYNLKTTKSKKPKHVGVYITNHKNKTIELPVNPSEIEHLVEFDSTVQTITSFGEYNQIGNRKVTNYEFEFMLPKKPKAVNYRTAQKFKYTNGVDYIKFIRTWQDSKKAGRMLITGGNMNLPVKVVSFKWAYKNGNESEWICTISLTQDRPITLKKRQKKTKKRKTGKKGKQRSKPNKKIGKGSIVIVNGTLHRDSAGSGSGAKEKNAKRKINIVNPGAKFPYHVMTFGGGWRGWVSKKAVKLE